MPENWIATDLKQVFREAFRTVHPVRADHAETLNDIIAFEEILAWWFGCACDTCLPAPILFAGGPRGSRDGKIGSEKMLYFQPLG